MRHTLPLSVGALAFAALLATNPAVTDPVVTVVMSGLDNPRGLAFDRHGSLYVAEAGRGGTDLEDPADGFCFTGLGAGTRCYGPTGAVSRLRHGRQDRIATGLPSHAFPLGASAIGPHDISFASGRALVTMGLEADPAFRDKLLEEHPDFPDVAMFDRLVSMNPGGAWQPLVDVAAYEVGGGPEPRVPDSNPYGLLPRPVWPPTGDEDDGDEQSEDQPNHEDQTAVLTDAGGNTLLHVDADGAISLLGVFPSHAYPPPPNNRSTDSVPTSVTIGPDGAYYVGELCGIPFVGPNREPSNIYRVAPGQDPTIFLDGRQTGFNAIIDIAFKGQDLYVVEHWTPSPAFPLRDGRLVRVACGGTPLVCDGTPETVLDGLERPTSIAVGPDGALYVTQHGTSKAIGEVLRIEVGP